MKQKKERYMEMYQKFIENMDEIVMCFHAGSGNGDDGRTGLMQE